MSETMIVFYDLNISCTFFFLCFLSQYEKSVTTGQILVGHLNYLQKVLDKTVDLGIT